MAAARDAFCTGHILLSEVRNGVSQVLVVGGRRPWMLGLEELEVKRKSALVRSDQTVPVSSAAVPH